MAVDDSIVKALKGTGSGYWMALPPLLAILAIVAYPLAVATYYSSRRVLPGLPKCCRTPPHRGAEDDGAFYRGERLSRS